MMAESIFVEKLTRLCSQPKINKVALADCCKEIREKFKFDCVFLAHSNVPEEVPSILAFDGNEEVVETCLYRLGVEERLTLANIPLKTYPDMTGKPVFNKSGSLRILKPSSGIFLVLNRPKKDYILLGCAHLISQSYDQKLLEELGAVWRAWREILEKAVRQFVWTGTMETPTPVSSSTPKLDMPTNSPGKQEPKLFENLSEKRKPEKKDGRRPMVLVDEVTRLFNRNYFEECLAIEVERAKRYSRTMSLLFLSVSSVGPDSAKPDDQVIATQIAEILWKSLRRVDVICRLDPNRYGIILPDTANNTYGIIAKRVFRFFKEVMGDAPPVFINVSASSFPKHASDHHTLYENAVKLLLQAQEVGPNKAVLPE